VPPRVPAAAVAGGLLPAARRVAEDIGKTVSGEGTGWAQAARCGLLSPCGGTQAGTCEWGARPMGPEMSGAGFSPRSLLPPGSHSAGEHCCPGPPCLLPAPPRTNCCGAPRHPPGVTRPAQSSTALGEPGALGRPVGALPMLSCSGPCAVGSRVVGLGYFGVQPAPLTLPLGWGCCDNPRDLAPLGCRGRQRGAWPG